MKVNLIRTNSGIDSTIFSSLNLSDEEKTQKLVEELCLFAGRMGGECYSSDSLEHIMKEDEKDTRGRMKFCLSKKHHSIFEHPKLTFEFVGVPKFIFMMLNNQYVYSTSERSARYTDFEELIETDRERKLYTKWTRKISEAIRNVYGEKFTDKEVQKLAQENARYMISVFVPSSMVHTISLKDLNYTIFAMESFLNSAWKEENEQNKAFMMMLKPRLEEFLALLSPYKVEGLQPKFTRGINIFKKTLSKENIADASYRLNYDMSFAAFAQDHRHRSIRYSIELIDEKFYVPPIIEVSGYKEEWLEDMSSVTDVFPQGAMINVTECGEIEDFVSKCYERCCGRAQLEIANNTCDSLEFLRTTNNQKVANYLTETTGEAFARCAFPNYHCVEVCKFGRNQRERKI